MARYILVIDSKENELAKAKKKIEKTGVKVVDSFDFINTLVVDGKKVDVQELKASVPSIISIEREGHVEASEED